MIAVQAAACLLLGYFFSESTLYAHEALAPLACLIKGQLAAAAGRTLFKGCFGDLNIDADLMMEAEVFVDICCCDLTSGDCKNRSCKTGYAVAAGEYAIHVLNSAAAAGDESAALCLNALCFEGSGNDDLTDSDDNDIGRNTDFGLIGGLGTGTAFLINSTCALGLYPKSNGIVILILLDADGSHQSHELDALSLCAFNLFRKSGNILLATTICDADGFCAEADGTAAAVHSNVAAADNDYILACEIGEIAVADAAQHFDCGHDAAGIFALDADLPVGMRADGDINCIILFSELCNGDIFADHDSVLNFNTGLKDCVDVLLELFTGQTIAGDTVAEHTAEVLTGFENGDLMPHKREEVCSGEAARAAADYGNGLAGGFAALGSGNDSGMVNSEALQAADIDRTFNEIAAAVSFTGMLADTAAGCGEGIILTDKTDCIGIPAGSNEGNITGNIHVCRAFCHAGNGLAELCAAAAESDMGFKIITETADRFENKVRSLKTDGTVRRG